VKPGRVQCDFEIPVPLRIPDQWILKLAHEL
jgi:hypothetical protein